MKILHCVPKISTGGVASVVLNLYRNINKDKYHFDILTHDEEDLKEIRKKYPDLVLFNVNGIGNGGLKKYLKSIKEVFDSNYYDIVHIHTGHLTGLYAFFIRKYFKGNIVLHAHATQIVNSKHRMIMPFLKALTYNRKYYRVSCGPLAGKFCFGKKKFTIIENGIQIDLLNSDQGDSETRKLFEKIKKSSNLEENVIIGNISNFTWQKNHVFLIKLFKTLLDRNNKYHLVLVGNGQLFEKTKNMVKFFDLEENVHFLGHKNNVGYILRNIDVFIMPSLSEGLPLAAIEAQACRKWCLLSENIDKSVSISPNVKFLPLDNLDLWIKMIVSIENYETKPFNIKNTDYDIESSVKKLSHFYDMIIEKRKGEF